MTCTHKARLASFRHPLFKDWLLTIGIPQRKTMIMVMMMLVIWLFQFRFNYWSSFTLTSFWVSVWSGFRLVVFCLRACTCPSNVNQVKEAFFLLLISCSRAYLFIWNHRLSLHRIACSAKAGQSSTHISTGRSSRPNGQWAQHWTEQWSYCTSRDGLCCSWIVKTT